MVDYSVQAGDCLSTIGSKFGFDWQFLWNLDENATLRQKRRNPNIILIGDIVFVPDKEPGGERRSTGARHRFKVKGNTTKVRIRLLFLDQPRVGLPCTLEIDGRKVECVSDSTGLVQTLISPTATLCKLTAHDPVGGDEVHFIGLGLIDPVDEPTGIQQRLNNLGYNSGPVDGLIGPITRSAIREFQTDQKLQVDGIAGPITKGRLVKIHGS